MRKILKNIDEQFVKDTLSDYKQIINEIHTRMLAAYNHLDDADELMEEVAYKSITYDDVGSGGKGAASDLANVLLRHFSLSKERSRDIRMEMWQLTEEEESRDRIWFCYKALGGDGFAYLTELYVNGTPYKAVESASGVSHKTFETRRAYAIKDIINLYNSDLTNSEIIVKGTKKKKYRDLSHSKKSQRTGYEQLKLFDE